LDSTCPRRRRLLPVVRALAARQRTDRPLRDLRTHQRGWAAVVVRAALPMWPGNAAGKSP